MSRRHIYDNWEKLVVAVLKKEHTWELFHDQSRSSSNLSEASDFSCGFNLNTSLYDVAFDFSGVEEAFAKPIPKLILVSDFSPAFDVENVVIVSSELLGSGTFVNTYKIVMNDDATIVVKRLQDVCVSEMEFKRNMEIIGNVKHENVVALRGYYSSKGEKLMLFDHYNKRDVHFLLHGKTGENHAFVEWETRLRIAIGVARGLAEIHGRNGNKLFHGNIKTSNIFVNSQQYGCISDLGFAIMVSRTFKQSGWYHDPEDISQALDVYSFGVLLLELLTRKSPKAVDLVKLVTSVKSKKIAAKVLDEGLLKNASIKDQMEKMLEIGISCVVKSVKRRPKMSKVVKLLENISWSVYSLQRTLIFVEDDNHVFNLEDMLRASFEDLGVGTCGNSYKALLENGNSIAVKRLKDVIVTYQQFQKYVEVIGRMRHENVVSLRGYYFSKEEKFMVYEYYNRGSVSSLLHESGDRRTPLDWEIRLKITVGAARGIAHIHRQDGQTFVHGNIKASNIFLNRQQYGLVSETGLAKMTPIKFSTPCYLAPEVVNTRKISQASDVYSLGVFILELVSGKPPQYTTDDGEVISLVKWIQSVPRNLWTIEVFDAELLRYESDHEEAMLKLLQIALDCVNTLPEQRPIISKVVKMLDEIFGIYNGNQLHIESRLEGSLEDLLPMIMQ